MRWGDSIPIVEGEIGPPRSGFVHRLCIRKADGAWGEAARDDGPADTRFCRTRISELADTGGRWFLSGCYRKIGTADLRNRG